MKRISTVLFLPLLVACIGCVSDEEPTNILTAYNLSSEIQGIFDKDVLKATGNLEDFLNTIKANGMVITEGSLPPAVHSDIFKGQFGLKYTTKYNCIYDNKNPKNKGESFGSYAIEILIDTSEGNFAKLDYSYLYNRNYDKFRNGIDSGSGEGYGSGNGDNFTFFIPTGEAMYDDIRYKALWIISGTYSFYRLTNLTQCFIILEKGNDPDDKMANPGTIRIFKDDNPVFYWN